MFFSKRPPLIVGLDIGTRAIKLAVGERRPDDGLTMIGSHSAESRGLRKGEVINHEEAGEAVLRAIQETEDALNMSIGEVQLSITGGHVESANHRGTIPVRGEDGVVTDEDVEEVVDNARSCVRMSEERAILHVVRQQFYLDGKDGVSEPVGQNAARLEADVHCIYGIGPRFQNTINCLYGQPETTVAHKDAVFSGLASALAVLGPHEKQLGAIVLDIGAGATEYVVYAKNMIRQTGVLAVGGDHLVNDLQLGLKLSSRHRAEKIIRDHGSVWLDEAIRGKTVTVKTGELLAERERVLYLEHIHVILNCRMDEILRIIHERVRAQGLNDLVGGGVYLTGGCARMGGLPELARSIFEMDARIAVPQGFDGQIEHLGEPEMSTAVGLVKYAHMKRSDLDSSSGGLIDRLKRTFGMEE